VTSAAPECRGLRGNSCPVPVEALAGEAAEVTRVSRNVYWPRSRNHDSSSRVLHSMPSARLASRLTQVPGCGAGKETKTIRSRKRFANSVASVTKCEPKKCCSIPASTLCERSGRRFRLPMKLGSCAKFCKKLGSEIPAPVLAFKRVVDVSRYEAANRGVAFLWKTELSSSLTLSVKNSLVPTLCW